jgi:hypothetical protein
MAISPSLIDKRVVQRSIKKGLLEPEQYRRILDELPDLSQNIAEVEPLPAPQTRTPDSGGEQPGEAASRALQAASGRQPEPGEPEQQVQTGQSQPPA